MVSQWDYSVEPLQTPEIVDALAIAWDALQPGRKYGVIAMAIKKCDSPFCFAPVPVGWMFCTHCGCRQGPPWGLAYLSEEA